MITITLRFAIKLLFTIIQVFRFTPIIMSKIVMITFSVIVVPINELKTEYSKIRENFCKKYLKCR